MAAKIRFLVCWKSPKDDAEIDYVDEVVEGVKARQAEIDEWIAQFAHGWSLETHEPRGSGDFAGGGV